MKMTRLIDADYLVEYWKPDGGRMFDADYFIWTVEHAPTVDAVPVIRCKDCKYFDLNHVENVSGIPLIVAHEICMLWGGGCRTKSDGYCAFGERKEE